MFIGVYELDGKTYNYIYKNSVNGWKEYHADTFSPNTNIIGLLEFKLSGKTYEERKASAEDLAKEYQLYYSCYDWSYMELTIIYDYFEKVGKKYGLLKVFKENAIC